MTSAVTWRGKLHAAQAQYREGIENRRCVAREAHEAGLSYRQIAEGLGLSATAAHKLVGANDGSRRIDLLDAPVKGST